MKFTLGDIRNSRFVHATNTCSTDDRLVQWANAAQERLMNCGRWYGTVVRAKFCVSDGCLVWPREVATIERINLCSTPIRNYNLWYEFTEYIAPSCVDCCFRTDPRLIALSDTPTISDIEDGKAVIAVCTNAADAGTEIVVQGNDDSNAWVRTDDGGTPIDGEKIAFAVSPGTAGAIEWAEGGITGIQKDDTDYDVLLYQYDLGSATTEKLLGRYQPNEKYPNYRRSQLKGIENGCCDTDCDDPTYTIEAIASLQHVPVSADRDWFLIQNQYALELAMQAIVLEEDNKDDVAEVKWKKAIRELQRQNGKYEPSTNARIITTGFGTAHPDKLFANFM